MKFKIMQWDKATKSYKEGTPVDVTTINYDDKIIFMKYLD